MLGLIAIEVNGAHGAKNVFLTNQDDADVARAAINNGALGYILRHNARDEFVLAMEVVLEEISSSAADFNATLVAPT